MSRALLTDNTASLLAAEATYFTQNRGMGEEAVAELLAVSVPAVRHLLTKATRHTRPAACQRPVRSPRRASGFGRRRWAALNSRGGHRRRCWT